MFTPRFLWIAAALSAMFLAGCGTPVYRQGNLTQGVFETSVPENFTGAGKEFAAGSSIKGVSLSFDYYECSAPTEEGCKEKTEEKHLEKKNVRQGRQGAGIFTSFYMNGLAISYSPLLYVPTIEQEYELHENDPHGNTLRTRVDTPFILSQYAGVSKWIDEHWKVSLGATVLSSLYFNDFYLTANASLGFWF